ncbi:MAG: twitching motility protein [Acidimicrobiales bacterium]|nr:twitching motility protein [Acidimicrobiales bacterium]
MNQVDPSPIASFLAYAHALKGTDLHLTVGAPPLVRQDGVLMPMEGEPPLDAFRLEALLLAVLGPALAAEFHNRKEIDFAFDYDDHARFRGNVFRQRGTVGCALRRIPAEIPSFAELGLPPVVEDLVDLPQGLVLVTGPTGSGKSTTLASMIDWINTNRRCHILTIEDPLEYLHDHKRSVVNQREIGPDADDFHQALRAALREDPDVLLVGEMRDPESIAVALSIAETGHLVFATLHTNDSAQALDRIIDVFPAERRDQIQVQLASTLQAVIYQRLLPRTHGGLVAAFEVMRANHAVRNLLREGKTRQLRNVIATHQSEGMQTLETSLTGLVADGIVTHETALGYSLFPKEVKTHRAMLVVGNGGVPASPADLLGGAVGDQPLCPRTLARR